VRTAHHHCRKEVGVSQPTKGIQHYFWIASLCSQLGPAGLRGTQRATIASIRCRKALQKTMIASARSASPQDHNDTKRKPTPQLMTEVPVLRKMETG
jgi:hypothetical protein